MINSKKFINLALEKFPELEKEINDDIVKGLLHPQMSCLVRASEQAVSNGDFVLLKRYYDFLESIFDQADEKVKNAIYVSYLEDIIFDSEWEPEKYKKAIELLPKKLHNAFVEMKTYLDSR